MIYPYGKHTYLPSRNCINMSPSNNSFGLTVAYLLPGFIALFGIAPLLPSVNEWLRPVDQGSAGFGPAVYALLAATAAGMIVSCIRWMTVDWLHHRHGITAPEWDDAALDNNLAAFNYIVENHYRYAQFYGNTVVAVIFAYTINRCMKTSHLLGLGTDLAAFCLCAVLFAGSRDALAKYYNRTRRLVGVVAEKGVVGDFMTNGNHHSQESGSRTLDASVRKAKSKAKLVTKASALVVTAPKSKKSER